MKKLLVLVIALALTFTLVGCTTEKIVEVEVIKEVEVEVEVIVEVEVEKVVYMDRYVNVPSDEAFVLKETVGLEEVDVYTFSLLEDGPFRILLAGNQWNMGFIIDGEEYFIDGVQSFDLELEAGDHTLEVFTTGTYAMTYELWFWYL